MKKLPLFLLFSSALLAGERVEKAQKDLEEAKRGEAQLKGEYYCEPLCVGLYNFQLKGGIAPIVWTGREHFQVPTCENFKSFHRLPPFHNLFSLPWMLGVEFGFALTNHIEIYSDFHYIQASGKHFSLHLPNHPVTLHNKFSDYKSLSLYLGTDYHLEIAKTLSFLYGIKIGFTHHVPLKVRTRRAHHPHVTTYIPGNNVFSGGGRIGLKYRVWKGLSLFFLTECLANSGPRLEKGTIESHHLPPIQFPSISTEIVFPITLGLHYVF